MNEQVNQIIENLGVTVEMWIITYTMFIQKGFDEKKAMAHTEALVRSIITSSMGGKKSE